MAIYLGENKVDGSGGGGSSAGIFYAECETTTFSEVKDAYDAGMDIVCVYDGGGGDYYYYSLNSYYEGTGDNDGLFWFSAIDGYYGYLELWYLYEDDSWAWDNYADSEPSVSYIAQFDSSAHMNSKDMSSADVSTFVSGLNVSGGGELLKTATFTATLPVTSANTYWGLQFTGTTPTGYTPIGIISIHMGTSNAYVSGFYIDGNGVPNAFGRTTNAQGSASPATAVVLFIKQ